MAYAQWVVIFLTNSSSKQVVVKNVQLPWGKFYNGDNKDDEIPASVIEGTKLAPRGGNIRIASCGRENSTSGTEGTFDVWEDGPGGKRVRNFFWDCPWGSKTNTWTVSDLNPHWVVESSGANLDSGALGDIRVDMVRKAGHHH